MSIREYEKKVEETIGRLPDGVERVWLVAAYLSLKAAERLGYRENEIAALGTDVRDEILGKLLFEDITSAEFSKKYAAKWISGYFYNNAVFRIAALSEIALTIIGEQEGKDTNLEKKELLDWYIKKYGERPIHLIKIIDRTNYLKNRRRDATRTTTYDELVEGIEAFGELLKVISKINR